MLSCYFSHSLVTAILLLAMQRPKWSSWLAYSAFTVLNLYTHYGALVVFVAQGILIALWSLKKIINRQFREIIYPVIGVGIVLALLLPWLPRLLVGLERNVATDRISGTGIAAPLGVWFDVAYSAFCMYSDILTPLLFFLCLLGLLYWLIDRAC